LLACGFQGIEVGKMREILFRGKRYDDGNWVEGYLIHDEFCNTHIAYIGYLCDAGHDVDIAEIILGTVGQFTGLTDKNGKKIFEGDILSTKNGTFSNTGMGHVLFYKGMWTSFYGQDAIGRDCYDELHTVCNEREVIGNIHDNPELLGGNELGV
jgi:uncharacterized phage protein (TIGR01671 family)